jgi:hypothetical protein
VYFEFKEVKQTREDVLRCFGRSSGLTEKLPGDKIFGRVRIGRSVVICFFAVMDIQRFV